MAAEKIESIDPLVLRLRARFQAAEMALTVLKDMGLVTDEERELIGKRIKKGKKRYSIN